MTRAPEAGISQSTGKAGNAGSGSWEGSVPALLNDLSCAPSPALPHGTGTHGRTWSTACAQDREPPGLREGGATRLGLIPWS